MPDILTNDLGNALKGAFKDSPVHKDNLYIDTAAGENKNENKPPDANATAGNDGEVKLGPDGKPVETNANTNNNSSLNDGKDGKGKGTEDPPPPPPTFESLLAERSGGKYKAWEEVDAELSKPRDEFSNDYVKKFNEFQKDFADPQTAFDIFVEHQTNDYGAMEPWELIIMQEAMNNPTLTEDQIRAIIEHRYQVDAWSDDDAEGPNKIETTMNALIAADGEKARAALKAQQQKVLVENKKPDPKIAEQALKDSQTRWKADIDKSLQSLDKVTLKVTDKDTVDYALSKEDVADIKAMAYETHDDVVKVLMPFISEEGKISGRKLAETLFKMKNFDKVIRKATEQAFALGQKNVAKDLKNINFSADPGSTTDTGAKGQDKQIASQLEKML